MRLVALLPFVIACGSYTTHRTTRITPADRTQWMFGAQVAGAALEQGEQGAAPIPEFSGSVRRAVHEDVEVQVNATLLPIKQAPTGSLEVAGKLRIGQRGRYSLAVGAGAGYRIAESGGAIIEGAFISAPLIAGIDLGRHQLVFAIDGGYQRWYSSGAKPVSVPFVGDSIGFLWRINQAWSLHPEIGVGWSPTRNFMTDNSRLFHFGVAASVTR